MKKWQMVTLMNTWTLTKNSAMNTQTCLNGQAKVMQIMPIAFSVMFVFFPAGLVLYWLINNCIQIFQQWHMNYLLEKEAAAAAAKKR